MTLNHINLAVTDVQKSKQFLMKYFGLDPQGKEGNDVSAVLRHDHGMVLTLSNFSRGAEVSYPETFHIGFAQLSRE
jgi:catechol 2,3-dioxygenase-like lactoylglutathione lyase family enzyme